MLFLTNSTPAVWSNKGCKCSNSLVGHFFSVKLEKSVNDLNDINKCLFSDTKMIQSVIYLKCSLGTYHP